MKVWGLWNEKAFGFLALIILVGCRLAYPLHDLILNWVLLGLQLNRLVPLLLHSALSLIGSERDQRGPRRAVDVLPAYHVVI